LLVSCAPLGATTPTNRDPLFDKYPLGQWVTAGRESHVRWRVEVPLPELSTHQRLIARVVTHFDGRELARRRSEGEMLVLFQYRDAEGHIWQHHASLDLGHLQPNIQASEVTVTNFAFILPGDYSVTVAAIDTHTGEHSVVVRKLHVAPLRTDPLPGAWAGLPEVEFIAPTTESPDVWFLPTVQNHLRLPLQTRRRIHLQILVNTTPSERASGSAAAMRRNMNLLIPALKTLSSLEIANGSIDAAFLDLTNRRVPFEQKDLHEIEWERARQFFVGINPGLIDVRALQGQWKIRRFFWDEISRRLAPSGDALNVVIVLSGPAFFEQQEAVESGPVETASGQRLYYIRYRNPPVRQRVRPRPGMRPPPSPTALAQLPVDDLEHTVEPLGAHLYDATNAEQFRRVLGAILEQLSQL